MKHTKNLNYTHFYWLDALRFAAAFMVLLSHSRNDFLVPYNIFPLEERGIIAFLFYALRRLGHESVIIYFVLSSFLVARKGVECVSNGTFNLKNYALDRGVRKFANPL